MGPELKKVNCPKHSKHCMWGSTPFYAYSFLYSKSEYSKDEQEEISAGQTFTGYIHIHGNSGREWQRQQTLLPGLTLKLSKKNKPSSATCGTFGALTVKFTYWAFLAIAWQSKILASPSAQTTIKDEVFLTDVHDCRTIAFPMLVSWEKDS